MFETLNSKENEGRCLFLFAFYITVELIYCLCGLVVRVPGYRSRGPGLIPGTIRFSEK
jgi:hypothetical protein